MKGTVFDIQHFSIHDGPGIRTTVFLKGCPLRCLWCHNPESQDPLPQIGFWEDRCIRCGVCEKACPRQACSLADSYRVSRERCNLCRICVYQCPVSALEIIGKEMSVEEVVEEVVKDENFYFQSGGGVTISGGEPLYQHEFALSLARYLKRLRYHVALDTSGYLNGDEEDLRLLLNFAEVVDLVLYDIKLVDREKHEKFVGVPNETILENAYILALQRPRQVLFRYPLIPGINDSPQDIRNLRDFLNGFSECALEILPYHRLGIRKYKLLGQDYELQGIAVPDEQRVKEVCSELVQNSRIRILSST